MVQSGIQGYLELIKKANAIFEKSYPGSILFGATGRPNSGVAMKEEDLKNWTFRALTEIEGKTAQLTYSDGQFGKPELIGHWVGSSYVPLPQGKIRLPEAIEILNKNGYTQGFSSVSLGTPVVPNPQPMFWFCVNQETQGVSASTGEFFQNLGPCR
ncbi:MAG: hypothetical protein QNJ51_28340 [Calothrix sp. MO_167.B12]|nr:hypothetical protein [Calothrix sp. MO_167.B12]